MAVIAKDGRSGHCELFSEVSCTSMAYGFLLVDWKLAGCLLYCYIIIII